MIFYCNHYVSLPLETKKVYNLKQLTCNSLTLSFKTKLTVKPQAGVEKKTLTLRENK